MPSGRRFDPLGDDINERIPKHITPTIALCFVPYLGLLLFLVFSHRDQEVLRHPGTVWLAVLAGVGALAPLWRLAAMLRLMVREKDRFHISLLSQVYASLILVFASLYALLQVGQVDAAFGGMLEFWTMEGPGTLAHPMTPDHERHPWTQLKNILRRLLNSRQHSSEKVLIPRRAAVARNGYVVPKVGTVTAPRPGTYE